MPHNNDTWYAKTMYVYKRTACRDIREAEAADKQMYVCEYLDRLAASPRTWYLTSRGWIRNHHGRGPHNYLLALINHPFKGPGAIRLAELCRAAEGDDDHLQNVRKALLIACGLDEEETSDA